MKYNCGELIKNTELSFEALILARKSSYGSTPIAIWLLLDFIFSPPYFWDKRLLIFFLYSQYVDFLLVHVYQVTEDVQNMKSKLNNLESKLEEVS